MNLFSHFRDVITSRITQLMSAGQLPEGLDLTAITVEPPRDASHGDVATNAAMVLAKPAKMNPRDIAQKIVAALSDDPDIEGAEAAGPGFINIRLKPQFWGARLKDILAAGPAYGDSNLGAGQKVNVEYVSANPTGPLHVGHCRGAVFGDALANLLGKAGFDVTREYYMNDAGGQVDVLARSVHLRYREALGETIGPIPEGLYPADYLKPVGAALASEFGTRYQTAAEAEWLPVFRPKATDAMMALIREDLELLGIHQDEFFSERSLHHSGRIDEALAALEGMGHIYTGVLEPPKGKPAPEDWEPRPQTLFRSTAFGDDIDRALKKSDGAWTYFAADIAYHLDKFQRGFHEQVDVWGADHSGYIKRMQAAVKAISNGQARLDVKICQIVKLFKGGEPYKMSKRAGTFVTARDMIEEVGKDVLRFLMLTRKNDAPFDFDLEKALEQSKDNPVFYVQYAHARICSVLRAAEAHTGSPNPDLLTAPEEQNLIRLMAQWPRAVEQAALSHEPHRIAFFVQELAALFHALWNRGKEDPSLRFLIPDQKDLTLARLSLITACRDVIASGLKVLGVKPVEEMR